MTSRTRLHTRRLAQRPSMPQRHLQLVHDSAAPDAPAPERTPTASRKRHPAAASHTADTRALAEQRPLTAALKSHRVAVARWALAQGRTLNLDVLSVILAARRYQATLEDRPFAEWTRAQLQTFVTTSLPSWLGSSYQRLPAGWTDTLATYLDALADAQALDGNSSRRVVLQATLAQLA